MAALKLVMGLVALAALAGCVEDGGTAGMAPLRMAPASDESACLTAVGNVTNNTVTVLESVTSEANNMVTIGVGPERARWQCLVNGGVVVQTMSMTDEGSL
jgi:hypothetical protein